MYIFGIRGIKPSIHLASDRDQWRALVNIVMKLQVPQNAGEFLSSQATGGFSKTLFHGLSYKGVSRHFIIRL
jgi:hypothetical protein